jgi:hypothetical protein
MHRNESKFQIAYGWFFRLDVPSLIFGILEKSSNKNRLIPSRVLIDALRKMKALMNASKQGTEKTIFLTAHVLQLTSAGERGF